jgi:hypothetical protein
MIAEQQASSGEKNIIQTTSETRRHSDDQL